MILLIGNGIISDHIAQHLTHQNEKYKVAARGLGADIRLDLSEPIAEEWMEQQITSMGIDAAVFCAGESNPNKVFAHPDEARIINVQHTTILLRLLNRLRIKTIFLSSVEVFPGSKFGYAENDVPDAITVYGKYKTEVEREIVKLEHCIVARTTWNIPSIQINSKSSRCPIKLTLDTLKNPDAEMAVDSYFNPVLAADAAEIIYRAIQRNLEKKIIHIAPRKFYSRYDFALMLKKKLNLNGLYDPKPVEFSRIVSKRVEPRPRINVLLAEETSKWLQFECSDIETHIKNIALDAATN